MLSMALLSISEVAREVGLRSSAIRYYEELGVLPRPQRISGQRRYDRSAVYRLAILRRAQEAGFTLDEIRQFFFQFRRSTSVSMRWKTAADKKLAEIDARIEQLRSMKGLLLRLQTRCGCETVEECGAAILRGGFRSASKKTAGYRSANRR